MKHRGPPWHKLRKENFEDVELDGTSGVLSQLIKDLMRSDPGGRPTVEKVCAGPVVTRARAWMAAKRKEAARDGRSLMLGSPLAKEEEGFVWRVLGVDGMDLCS